MKSQNVEIQADEHPSSPNDSTLPVELLCCTLVTLGARRIARRYSHASRRSFASPCGTVVTIGYPCRSISYLSDFSVSEKPKYGTVVTPGRQ